MIEIDVGLAALISLLIVGLSLTTVWMSTTTVAEMVEHAREQRDKIVFSDYLLARYGVYDEHCRSVIPQTLGELPDELKYRVSIRKLDEPSKAKGIVIRRIVFIGNRSKENERILEVW